MERIEQEHGYYTTDDLGRFHSYNDEPAILVKDHLEKDDKDKYTEVSGYRAWYKNGQMHRDGLPAVIRNSGEEYFYLDGNQQDGSYNN